MDAGAQAHLDTVALQLASEERSSIPIRVPRHTGPCAWPRSSTSSSLDDAGSAVTSCTLPSICASAALYCSSQPDLQFVLSTQGPAAASTDDLPQSRLARAQLLIASSGASRRCFAGVKMPSRRTVTSLGTTSTSETTTGLPLQGRRELISPAASFEELSLGLSRSRQPAHWPLHAGSSTSHHPDLRLQGTTPATAAASPSTTTSLSTPSGCLTVATATAAATPPAEAAGPLGPVGNRAGPTAAATAPLMTRWWPLALTANSGEDAGYGEHQPHLSAASSPSSPSSPSSGTAVGNRKELLAEPALGTASAGVAGGGAGAANRLSGEGPLAVSARRSAALNAPVEQGRGTPEVLHSTAAALAPAATGAHWQSGVSSWRALYPPDLASLSRNSSECSESPSPSNAAVNAAAGLGMAALKPQSPLPLGLLLLSSPSSPHHRLSSPAALGPSPRDSSPPYQYQCHGAVQQPRHGAHPDGGLGGAGGGLRSRRVAGSASQLMELMTNVGTSATQVGSAAPGASGNGSSRLRRSATGNAGPNGCYSPNLKTPESPLSAGGSGGGFSRMAVGTAVDRSSPLPSPSASPFPLLVDMFGGSPIHSQSHSQIHSTKLRLLASRAAGKAAAVAAAAAAGGAPSSPFLAAPVSAGAEGPHSAAATIGPNSQSAVGGYPAARGPPLPPAASAPVPVPMGRTSLGLGGSYRGAGACSPGVSSSPPASSSPTARAAQQQQQQVVVSEPQALRLISCTLRASDVKRSPGARAGRVLTPEELGRRLLAEAGGGATKLLLTRAAGGSADLPPPVSKSLRGAFPTIAEDEAAPQEGAGSGGAAATAATSTAAAARAAAADEYDAIRATSGCGCIVS